MTDDKTLETALAVIANTVREMEKKYPNQVLN